MQNAFGPFLNTTGSVVSPDTNTKSNCLTTTHMFLNNGRCIRVYGEQLFVSRQALSPHALKHDGRPFAPQEPHFIPAEELAYAALQHLGDSFPSRIKESHTSHISTTPPDDTNKPQCININNTLHSSLPLFGNPID
jgi:hypothetical protein